MGDNPPFRKKFEGYGVCRLPSHARDGLKRAIYKNTTSIPDGYDGEDGGVGGVSVDGAGRSVIKPMGSNDYTSACGGGGRQENKQGWNTQAMFDCVG